MVKNATSGLVTLLLLVGLGGSMAATNPSRAAYESYATRRLSDYLGQQVCADLPEGLGTLLGQRCRQLVEANEGAIATLVESNTQVQNFVVFSLFRTQLTVPGIDGLPAYEVETLGIFNQFLTYRAQRR